MNMPISRPVKNPEIWFVKSMLLLTKIGIKLIPKINANKR